MRHTRRRRKIDREAVAKSLRELEILFGKRPPKKEQSNAGRRRDE